MGLRDMIRAMSPTPVPLEELRPDLQECVEALHPEDAGKFLHWCGGYGAPLNDVPDSEQYLAVLPVVGDGAREFPPAGRGLLVLTSTRLMYMGDLDRLEIPMYQLSMSGWGYEDRRGSHRLTVSVAPNNDPIYRFAILTKPDSREHFLNVFENAVRDSENRRVSGTAALPSAADELAKFAKLRDEGVITNEEFEAKKAELLS